MDQKIEEQFIEPIANIDSAALYQMLKKKGIETFHHANTVKTSMSFINEGALLSRAYVEANGLFQTDQYTDEKDKKLGIWDSVFLDGLDLHRKFVRPNNYGPVLFHLDLKLLLDADWPKLRVTKSNPASWGLNERGFYETIEGIDKDYLTGDSFRDGRVMFLFDFPEKKIALDKYCKKIIVDDPRITLVYPQDVKKNISDIVKTSIEKTLEKNNLQHIPVEIRHPNLDGCNCYFQYKKMYQNNLEKFNKLFKK